MRFAVLALASMMLVSACADVVIPTEEEAASAGQSAAAAADAFISVFEERAEAERAELMAQLEDTGEPLFTTTTTVDPLDLFDPINDCRWGEASTFTNTAFTLQHPAFVEFDTTPDALGGYHATFDYGDCAPIVGDLSVLSFSDPTPPQVVVESQINAYRTLDGMSIVSAGPVSIPGAIEPGYQIEIRTGGDTHRIFVGVTAASGAIVVMTIHVPIEEWDGAAPVALDLLRGLAAG